MNNSDKKHNSFFENNSFEEYDEYYNFSKRFQDIAMHFYEETEQLRISYSKNLNRLVNDFHRQLMELKDKHSYCMLRTCSPIPETEREKRYADKGFPC